jgi:hypothetical protein
MHFPGEKREREKKTIEKYGKTGRGKINKPRGRETERTVRTWYRFDPVRGTTKRY